MADLTDLDTEAFLAHYGVKGMRWGHRSNGTEGVSRKTDREASSDAKEFARAKLFYGEGAGTRRKLIKAKVEAKSKQDPNYKKAFDNHLGKQDLGKHAEKARSERRRKDSGNTVKKTANSVNRAINGPFAGSAAIALVAAGAAYANRTGLDQRAANSVRNAASSRRAQSSVRDFLNNM